MAKLGSSKQVSEIDRLIEMASEKRNAPPLMEATSTDLSHVSTQALSLEDAKNPNPSLWRVLLQLRALAPYLARVLPLLERGLLGTNILGAGGMGGAKVDNSQLENKLTEFQAAQRDFGSQLKEQTGDIKYLQEQITWLSKSLELETKRQEEIVDGLASLKKLVRTWSIAVIVWLVVLIGVEIFSMLRFRG